MNKKTVYSEQYKGVTIEVQNFDVGGYRNNCWTYYLYISPDSIPDKEKAEELWLPPKYDDKDRMSYDYYGCWVSDLNWHGGITYYEKYSSVDAKRRTVKAGCDYQHIWDEDHHYDIDDIEADAKATVDQLIGWFPDYMRHCGMVGGYWLPSEGAVSEDGKNFVSKKGMEWHKKQYPDGKRWWEEIV